MPRWLVLRRSVAERKKRPRLRGLLQWAHLGSNQGPPACEAESAVPADAPRRAEAHSSTGVSGSSATPADGGALGHSPETHHADQCDSAQYPT